MADLKSPIRTNSGSDDEAVPAGDPTDTTSLLSERLRAWKHMCGYLEDYIKAVSHEQKSNAKDQEKVVKSISKPLREGHHFDQALGGVAGLFENIRANTSAIANMHIETSKNLEGTVLPMLERLHSEIKNKSKELANGAGKGSKAVEKARNESQKYIELLGTHVGNFDASGGKVSASNDPYVIQRGIAHRLNKQIIEENNHRQDIIVVQNSFQAFEAHVLQQVQEAINAFQQFMSNQADRHRAIFGDIASTAGAIPPDFEWNGFAKRNEHMLVNPNAAPRSMANVSFPNQDHRATKPLIEGSLERKSRALGALKGYSAGYYAVTPAGYLHEYKDNDNFRKDPTPEISLYLPDCTIGAVVDTKFSVKGKDVSGGKMNLKLSSTFDFNFKAHTPSDAKTWHDIISQKAVHSTSLPTSPISPTESRISSFPPTSEEREAQQAKEEAEKANATNGNQESGIVRSPTSASTMGGQGSHFHGQPVENALEERKYVQR